MTMDGAGLMVAIYETTSSLESALRLTIGPASLAVHCCWPCSVATPRLWQPSVRWGHASPRRLGSEENSSLWYGLLDEKKLLSPPIGHRSEIWKTGVVVISMKCQVLEELKSVSLESQRCDMERTGSHDS